MTRSRQHSGTPLEQRIRRQLLLVLLIVMTALVTLVHYSVSHLAREFVLTRLQHDGESLIAALNQNNQGKWELDPQRLPLVYQRVNSGHYYLIRSSETVFRSRSLWDYEPKVRSLGVGETSSATRPGVSDQVWLSWQRGFSKGGKAFSLWIAEDIAPLESEQWEYEIFLIVMVILSVPILLISQRSILHRGFAQLLPLQKALEAQQTGTDIEFPQNVPTEVAPLVEAIEQLLQRSGEQIKRSRTALGNLAHELKRPLQQLQWLAEQHPDPEQQSQLRQLNEHLQHMIDRELRRARIAGAPSPGHQFIAAEEIPLLEQLLRKIGNKGLLFEADYPEGPIPYDRDDMLELLGNLLDNAWRYASAKVRLTIRHQENQWCLCIEDDGAGVSDEDLAHLVGRGVRLDEQTGGHGLGLSICKAVVGSYSGKLDFGHSELGGLRVKICLPV